MATKFYETKAQVNQAAHRKAKVAKAMAEAMRRATEGPCNSSFRRKVRELRKQAH